MKENNEKDTAPKIEAILVENKKVLLSLFVLASIIALFVIAGNGIRYEVASQLGDKYLIKIEGYDPYNPIKGRYLMFTPDLSRVRTLEKLEDGNSATCYLSLAKEEDGYYFDKATLDKPKEGPYVKTLMHNNFDGSYWYQPPFMEYYLPEEIAAKAEIIMFENFDKAYVEVSIYKGIPVVENIYIDGVRLEEKIK